MKVSERVPEGWKKVKLGEVLKYEQPYKYIVSSTNYEDTGIPVLTAGKSFILGFTSEKDGVYKDLPVIIFDDFTTDNKFVDFPFKVKSSAMKFLKEKDENVVLKFVYESMQLLRYENVGGDHKRRWISEFQHFSILLPPLPEQRKIVEILETVDNAIEKTDKIIEKYKRIKQGLMQELLTKGIDENGQTRSEKTHRFKDSPLGRIPEEWEVVELSNKKATITITDGSHYSPQPVEDSECYIVNIENMTNGRIELNTCKKISKEDYKNLVANGCKPESNDVLFTKDGTIGISLVFGLNENIVLLSSIAILRPSTNLDSHFLKYYLESNHIKKQLGILTGGSALKRVVLRDIKNFKIPLPSLPEQQCIASILFQIDKVIENEQKYKEKLEKIKQGLMGDLLTGKVRVTTLIT